MPHHNNLNFKCCKHSLTLALLSIFFKVIYVSEAKYHKVIDVNDILSVDFMPGSILMLDNTEESLKLLRNSNTSSGFQRESWHPEGRNGNMTLSTGTIPNADGSIMGALNTMLFHRGKMNEYLCRNFIAEQIIDDMTMTRIRKRHSMDKKINNSTLMSNHKGFSLSDNLIEDEGSTQYKSWLTKSATLEDIYRHYQDVDRRQDDDDNDDDADDEKAEEDQYDHYIPGYSAHQPPIGPAKLGYSGHGISYPSSVGYGNSAPPSGGHASVQYGAHSPMHSFPSSHAYGHSGPPLSHHNFDEYITEIHHDAPKGHDSGGKDLSELFEIALTALAYLSFGMFIVHVVMCISHAKKKEHDTVIIVQASSTIGTVGTDMGMSMGMDGMNGDGGTTQNGNNDGGDTGGNDGGEVEGGGDDGGGDNDAGGGVEDGAGDGEEDAGAGGGNEGDDAGEGGVEGGDGGDDNGGDTGDVGGDNGGDNGEGDDGADNGGGDNGADDGGETEVTGDGGDGVEGDTIRFPSLESTLNNLRPWRPVINSYPNTPRPQFQRPQKNKKRPAFPQTQLQRPPTKKKPNRSRKRRKPLTKQTLKKAHKTDGYNSAEVNDGELRTWNNLGSGEVPPTGRSTRRRRRRRRRRRKRLAGAEDMPNLTNPNLDGLNELSRHVFASIQAAFVAHQDNGACLRRVLCENNRYSRGLGDNNRIWIPVWSLGMSWLSGKLNKNVPPATSMLDMLKASILGLGKANCENIFNDCDLEAEREKRRRSRKKT